MFVSGGYEKDGSSINSRREKRKQVLVQIYKREVDIISCIFVDFDYLFSMDLYLTHLAIHQYLCTFFISFLFLLFLGFLPSLEIPTFSERLLACRRRYVTISL